MKTTIYFTAICTLILSCVSCGKHVSYKTYTSHNKTYEVEIPSQYSLHNSINCMLAFTSSSENVTLSIDTIPTYVNLEDLTNDKAGQSFDYSIDETAGDSILVYKITRGNNMWCAHEIYQTKIVGRTKFVVKISSDKISKAELTKISNHICQSISIREPSIEESNTVTNNKQRANQYKSLSTSQYSIEYPNAWTVVHNVDEMIDAYIGESSGKFGCAISCFDTDYSFSKICEDMTENMRAINATINTASAITLNGQRAYKLSCEYSYGGQSVKEISYTFKKGNTLYNVKFGTNIESVNKNHTLIEHMISSFKIK